LAEGRPPAADDVVVRERVRRRRAIVLAVDVSGSMRGERLNTAAATVGALTAELADEDLSVIAFWSDATVLVGLREHATLEQTIDALLAIEPRGLTNVAFPLETAREQLRGVPGHERRVILLSDCVHNAGPDPRAIAATLPRLDVLFDASGECDPQLARDLARAGRGTVAPVRRAADVAPALSRMLAR
jgi:Mg-chelatase subunit ChlD